MNLTESDRLQTDLLIQLLQHRAFELDASWLQCQIKVLDTVPSTNRFLWEWIEQGADPGAVVIAAQQSAGKGQWGRYWRSPLGGLYLSLAIAPHCPIDQVGQLTLATAWGIASALHQMGVPVMLKWPNDLILHGRKLGGILIETRMQQGLISWAVIGIGINWANPTPDMGIALKSAISDRDIASQSIPSIHHLIVTTLQGVMIGYRQWQQQGIAAILPGYEALLTHVGQDLQIDHQVGKVVGVTETGELRVAMSASEATLGHVEAWFKPGEIRLGYN